MSNGPHKPLEPPAADPAGESPIDRALLAYLDDAPTPDMTAESAEARAELEEFLAADAELQQLVGALGPLAASMLRPHTVADEAGEERAAALSSLRLTPLEPTALESEEADPALPATQLEQAAADPGSSPPAASRRLLVWLLGASATTLLTAAAGAMWYFQPPTERVHTAHSPTAAVDPRPRRPFAASADLWKPLVAAPGEWRYRLGEGDPMAREGLAMPSARSTPDEHSLTLLGHPKYGAGLIPGSSFSASLAEGDGFNGPVVTPAVDNFCAEAWFKLNKPGKTTVVYVGHGGQNGFGLLLHDNAHAGRVTYMGLYGGVRFLDTNVDVKVGEPVHLAVVRASGQTTVYLNGRPFPFGDVRPHPADGVMNIGGSAEFSGQIDEARIWVFAPGGFKPSDLLHGKR